MYATNVGTNVLPITAEGKNITGQDSLYASAVIDKTSSELIVKIVNAGARVQDITIDLKGFRGAVNKRVEITTLHSNQPDAVNTLKAPNAIVPRYFSVDVNNNRFNIKALANAFYLCKINL